MSKKKFQAGFIKLSRNTLVSYLIVSTILVGTGLIFLFNPFGTRETEAAWFNDNWAYRKEVPITANAAADTDVFFSFTLDTATLITAGQLQSACQDIRVTDVNGNLLQYHVGRTNACNNAATTIDALAPYAPNSSTPTLIADASTFYVYYGNPSAVSKDVGAFSQSEAASYTVGTLGSAVAGPSPTLYWEFDQAQGTTAEDATSNGLDGTLNNTPTWQTENFCIASKCLFFDGANNENVSIADDPKLDFAASDNFTLGAWVKRSGASSANTVILQKSTANIASTYTGYKMYMDASGDLCFDIQDGTNAVDSACTSAVDFDDDGWHFVEGVKAATTSITLYVDGKQRAQDASIASTGTLANASTFRVGIDSDGTTNDWLGFIDETKVYRDQTARSTAQVLADYNARSNPEGVSAQLGNNIQNMPAALSNGLNGYWKLDESSGNASDSSGNSLTLTNNGTTTYVTGKFANGSEHVPASSQYLSTATTISGVKTVSFWVNPDSTTNYYISLTSGAYITSSAGTISATGFTSPTIYVNGIQSSTIAADTWQFVTVTSETAINANQFYVGREGSNYFDGTLDEVRTYNRALSSAEVSQLYNWAPGPVGYWKMDDALWNGTSQEAKDSSGNGNNGTATSGPTLGGGKYGKAGYFDGTNDYLSIGDPSSGILDMGTNSFTMSTWVYRNNTSTQAYVSKQNTGTGVGYKIESGNTDLYVTISDGTDSYTETYASFSNGTGNWIHIGAVVDGRSSISIYVNGRKVTTSGSGTLANVDSVSNSVNFNLAATGSSGTNSRFNGRMDDTRVYNYPRTPAQIVEDMNAGHPAPGSPVGTPVGFWKFNEGSDNTCSGGTNDACNSGSGSTTFDGTSTATRTNSGKLSRALDFDGSDDVVTITNAAGIDMDLNLATFTFSSWIYADSDGEADTGQIFNKGTNTYFRVDNQGSTDLDLECNLDRTTDTNVNVTDALTTAAWNHVACAWDGTTLSVFVNGLLRGSSTSGSGAIASDANNLLIGGDTSNNFDGKIDEFKVYNSALTAPQIALDANSASAQVLGAIGNNSTAGAVDAESQEYCIPGDSTTCSAPVWRLALDETTVTSGSTIFDTSGAGKTTTRIGGGTGITSSPKGKIGKSIDFDTPIFNNLLSTSSSFSPPSTITFETWIYPQGAGGGSSGRIFGTSRTSPSLFLITNGTSCYRWRADWSTDGQWFTPASSLVLNTWQHLTITYDSSSTSNSPSIYINGKLQSLDGSCSANVTPVGSYANANGEWTIGGDSVSTVGLDSTLDEVRVFDYIRTPAQIAYDYNRGAPIAHWKMDECQGTTINDSSGNSYTGTLTVGGTVGTCQTASTSWGNGVTGKRNYSIDLNGSSDYIQVTDTATLRFDAATSDFSLFAWVKRDANGEMNVISKEDADNDGYRLQFTSGNVVRCSVDAIDIDSTLTITDTNWHLVGCTIDRDGNGQVYLDGQPNGTATAISSEVMANTSNIRLGTRSYTSTNYLDGLLDDTRIYNTALTATQVKTLYNDGAARYGPVTGSP